MKRSDVEAALAAWREAERRLSNSSNGDRDALEADVLDARDSFQRISADYMLERIESLKQAEQERATTQPSTNRYHSAAKQEADIAAEIWDAARTVDEDAPDEARRES